VSAARLFRSTPPFDHATLGHRGEILIQPTADSRLERARQINPRTAVVAERLDKDFSDQAGVLDCAVLWACDILERVRADFVPRLFAREGCKDDRRGEDDRDDPSVSTEVVLPSL
jgi:hypothetical protein